jgi:hypothetical protein
MSLLKNIFFGFPSGKIGDLVFKKRNGKVYISRLPEFKKKPGELVVKNRDAFAVCNTFASALIKISLFRRCWSDSKIKAESGYLKIMKVNLKEFCMDENHRFILIPGDYEFSAEIKDYSLDNHKLSITFYPPDVKKSCRKISVQGVIELTQPADIYNKKIRFIPVYSDDHTLKDGEEFTLGRTFLSAETEIMKSYLDKKLIINAAAKDDKGEVLQWGRIDML